MRNAADKRKIVNELAAISVGTTGAAKLAGILVELLTQRTDSFAYKDAMVDLELLRITST